jgi:hypothetical protein
MFLYPGSCQVPSRVQSIEIKLLFGAFNGEDVIAAALTHEVYKRSSRTGLLI